MKRWVVWALVALSPLLSGLSRADSGYYGEILRGARSATFFFNPVSTPTCPLDGGIKVSFDTMVRAINARGVLRVIETPDVANIPDLGVLFLVDTAPANSNFSPGICNFIVKVSVYHSMVGQLRYAPEQKLVRVLAYQSIAFGSAPPHLLSKGAMSQIDELMAGFLRELQDARRQKAKS